MDVSVIWNYLFYNKIDWIKRNRLLRELMGQSIVIKVNFTLFLARYT